MSKKEHEEDIVQRINLEKIADDDGEWIDAPDDERVIMQSAIFQSFFNYINMAAEDAKLNDEGNLKGPVFSVELLGDATMLTLRIDETFVSVKVQKDYNSKIGKEVFISVPKNICHLYNVDTGERII